jgi:hypothetical protein
MLGYQGALNAGTTLANQNYQGGLAGAQAGQQTGLANLQGQLSAGQVLGQQGLGATQLLPTMANAQLLPGQIQEAAGTTLQQQQQNQLNAQYQNQLAQYQNPFSALKNLQAGLGVLGSSTQAANISNPNNMMQLMNLLGLSAPGMAQGVAGGLGSLLSSGLSGIGNLFSGGNNYSPYEDGLYNTPASEASGSVDTSWVNDPNTDYGQYL